MLTVAFRILKQEFYFGMSKKLLKKRAHCKCLHRICSKIRSLNTSPSCCFCSCFKYWSFSNKVFLKIKSLKKNLKNEKKVAVSDTSIPTSCPKPQLSTFEGSPWGEGPNTGPLPSTQILTLIQDAVHNRSERTERVCNTGKAITYFKSIIV